VQYIAGESHRCLEVGLQPTSLPNVVFTDEFNLQNALKSPEMRDALLTAFQGDDLLLPGQLYKDVLPRFGRCIHVFASNNTQATVEDDFTLAFESRMITVQCTGLVDVTHPYNSLQLFAAIRFAFHNWSKLT